MPGLGRAGRNRGAAERQRMQWWPLVTVAVIGGGLSAGVAYLGKDFDDQRVRGVLELRAEWRARDLQSKISSAADPLKVVAAFVGSRTLATSSAEFADIASRARSRDDTIRTLVWAPYVAAADRPDFERRARELAGADFRIRERGAAGLVEAPPRDAYLPLLFARLFEPSAVAPLGFDILSEPVRRAAALRARDEGIVVATPAVSAVLSRTSQPIFNVYLPVYAASDLPAGVEQRRAAWRGAVVGAMGVNTMLDAALADSPEMIETLHVAMGTGSGPGADQVVARYSPSTRRFEASGALAAPSRDIAFRIARRFDALGRRWSLTFDFPEKSVADLRSAQKWAWPATSLALTVLLLAYLYRRQGHLSRVERTVQERTEALRETGDRLQATIDAAPYAIVGIDARRTVRIWNAAAADMFGYPPEAAVGRALPLIPPGGEDEFNQHFARLEAGQVLRNIRFRCRRTDGKGIVTRFSAAPLFAGDGAFNEALYVLEDVTQREDIESQLHQAQKLEAVGQLTGGIAHDFNNILGVIVGNLDLLREVLGPAHAAAGMAGSALEAALRGGDVIRRLLTFSRRQDLNPTVFAVNEAIEGITPMIRQSIGERISVELSLDAEVGSIAADRHQLESALLNLAINARDAMPQGGRITIMSRRAVVDADNQGLYPGVRPGTYAAIGLADEGQGIPPEILERVFEPFFTTKPEGKGTGLGLSMVYGFMRQSGGTAKIYSEVGHGTTVRLYFPLSGAVPDAGTAVERGAPPTATDGETVLVVEDRADVRELAVTVLARLGYATIETQNAAEALAVIESGRRIDLVFSDIVMPGKMSGLDLAQEIRRRNLPIALLLTSGYASPQMLREQAQAAGLTVLSKPYRVADLADAISAALKARTGEAAR